MDQEGSSNSMPSLEFTSLSLFDNEIQPQTFEISSINYLLQQSTKPSSPIEKITSSAFEESDLIVGETFSNKEEAFLPRKEGKRCSKIENRWIRQETLALLKFRSEMDAAFRDVTLKSPLWEDISRKLKELGYNRSAKQCEEKLASIQRRHKRTKEVRAGEAGKKDLKSCSSSGQLEAIHRTNATSTLVSSATTPFVAPIETNTIISSSSAGANQPSPILTITPPSIILPSLVSTNPTEISNAATASANAAGITLSSTSLSSESDHGKAEGTRQQGQKRKRGEGARTWKTMMAFFEELTRKMLERQDAMQQKLLEAIEKGDRERMVKEEAWRRQEMARLAREKELLAQERAAVASRYKDLTTIFQNIAGHTIPIPPLSTSTAAPTPQPSSTPQQQQPSNDTELAIVSLPELQEMVTEDTTKNSRSTTSRWPKMEVQELVKLRTSLEPLHPGGPKGPLWEKVSVGMQQLGFDRSAKKCKEKWENINKYFRKVKERNGRVENSRNCPYFNQLDAFHRSRSSGQSSHMLQGVGASGSALRAVSPPQLQQAAGGTANESSHANDNNGHEENSEGDVGFGKDVARKLGEQSFQAMTDDSDKLEEPDNENMAQEGEDENEETEDE